MFRRFLDDLSRDPVDWVLFGLAFLTIVCYLWIIVFVADGFR